jgi:hypothetical protein
MILKLGSELGKRVELWGFEPQTSCMPWNAGPFTTARDRSPATGLSWPFVQNRSPAFIASCRADPLSCEQPPDEVCRLPSAWDRPDGLSATSMGPPGCQ